MKKIICLVLALVCAAAILTACNNDSTDETGGSQQEFVLIPLAKDGVSAYRVVMPENASGALKGAVNTLVSKLKKVTGVNVELVTDKVPTDGAGIYEIIIGNSRRSQMQQALGELPFADYKITAADDHFLIAAHSDELAVTAVFRFSKFLSDENIVRDEKTNAVSVRWYGDILLESDEYTLTDITFGTNRIKDYRIVYKDKDDYAEALAYALSDWMGRQCGFAPTVVSDKEPSAELEIILGDAARAETAQFYDGAAALGLMEYAITIHGNKICVAGAAPYSTEQAVEKFKEQVLAAHGKMDGISINNTGIQEAFAACEADYRFMQYNILAGLEGYGHGEIIEDEEYRKEITASIILGYDPDILVLNEFYDGWVPVLLPLLDERYDFVALDRKDGSTNYNLLAYKSERFTLLEGGYTDIAVASNKHKRAVVWAALEDQDTSERFLAFGTHLDHSGQGALEQRIKQVGKLKGALNQVLAKYDGTVVLMGDMNTRVGEKVYETLKTHTGLANAMEGNGGDIDCCFLNDKVTVAAVFIDNGHHTAAASDHKPIIVDVNVK